MMHRAPHFIRPSVLALALAVGSMAPIAQSSSLALTSAASELLATLIDPDESVRGISAELLGDVAVTPRGPGAELVAQALGLRLLASDEAWRVRSSAARSLGRLASRGSLRAIEPLVIASLTEGTDWRVRRAAVEALAAVGDGQILRAALLAAERPLVIETPRSTVEFTRVATAATTAALADADPRVRRLAALALSSCCSLPPAVTSPLVEALDDPDPMVRARAAQALRGGVVTEVADGSNLTPGAGIGDELTC